MNEHRHLIIMIHVLEIYAADVYFLVIIISLSMTYNVYLFYNSCLKIYAYIYITISILE